MKINTYAVAAALAALAPVSAASAATIVTGTTLTDTGAAWRSGATVYGQAGYYLPGANTRIAQPSFVSAFAPAAQVFPGIPGYAEIDDPTTTPGATPTRIRTGTFNPFPGTGQAFSTFAFTVGAGAPATIRLGLLFDNLDAAVFNPSAVQVVGGGATSPTVDLGGGSFNNRLADFVFFDIAGAVAGDSFSVSVTGGRQGCACLGGVSFDAIAAVPEPASWALMIGGVGAVGGALRRRAKVAARVRFV